MIKKISPAIISLAREVIIMANQNNDAKIQNETNTSENRTSIDGMGKHVRNLTVAAIVGIGAISISVIGFVISVVLR